MVSDTKGLESLIKRLKQVSGTTVEVGFFEDAKYDDGTPVATVAAYNEYGTRFHPARPFMMDTFTSQLGRKIMREAVLNVLKSILKGGSGGRTQRLIESIGKQLAELMKKRIADYPGHNSPATILRKGFDDPLYDTGKMLESVKFQIRKPGQKAL